MVRQIAFWTAAILAGLALGALTAFWALANAGRFVQRDYDGWTFNPLAGSEAADPYTRALIARTGLLALRAEETIYFNRAHDSDGAPLDEACVYELQGGPMPARWWSITIYAADNYLPRNDDHAFSIDATRVSPAADGAWRARVATIKGDAIDWISARGARRGYSLTLRLYQPRQEAREHPETIPFPTLRALSCPAAPA